jgi:hypothetical protein
LDTAGNLVWHPLCEILDVGSPNPLDEPWLPFPFTARQLAALMVDGWGDFIREKYGDWETGPAPDELLSLGMLAGKAKEALTAAYEAYREAAALAPRLDPELALRAQNLQDQYTEAREAAMSSFGVREPGISSDEREARQKRVEAAVADLKRRMTDASQLAQESESRWRRAVVQFLLLPLEAVSPESFRSQILAAVPPSRRAEALEEAQRRHASANSDEDRAHWELACALDEVKEQRSRLQAMHPTNLTEESLKANRLEELAAEADAISARLDEFEASMRPDAEASDAPANRRLSESLDVSLLADPDELCTAFASFGLKRAWFDDLNSRNWLRTARKVVGQGQRGRRRPPLFCPFEVMIGLVTKSRKRRLSEATGWRLLKAHFPKVYAAHSAGDPCDLPG